MLNLYCCQLINIIFFVSILLVEFRKIVFVYKYNIIILVIFSYENSLGNNLLHVNAYGLNKIKFVVSFRITI